MKNVSVSLNEFAPFGVTWGRNACRFRIPRPRAGNREVCRTQRPNVDGGSLFSNYTVELNSCYLEGSTETFRYTDTSTYDRISSEVLHLCDVKRGKPEHNIPIWFHDLRNSF